MISSSLVFAFHTRLLQWQRSTCAEFLFSYTRRTNYCVCTECRSHFMSSAPQPIMNQTRRFDSLLATVFIGTTSGADPNAPALFPAWHAPCMQLSSEGVDRRPVRGCPLPQPPRRQCAHTRPASGLRSPVSGRALFGVVAPAPRLTSRGLCMRRRLEQLRLGGAVHAARSPSK